MLVKGCEVKRVLLILAEMLYITLQQLHMWQSRVEIEDHSVLKLLRKSCLKIVPLWTHSSWGLGSYSWTLLWSPALIQQLATVKPTEQNQKSFTERYLISVRDCHICMYIYIHRDKLVCSFVCLLAWVALGLLVLPGVLPHPSAQWPPTYVAMALI